MVDSGRGQEEHLAWAAGLFDGEGSTIASGPWDTPRLSVAQAGTDGVPPEVLTRLRSILGAGSITGPQAPRQAHWKPQWSFVATGLTAIDLLGRLWPYLGPVKRRQADLALERYRRHPTPNPRMAAATGRPLRQYCRRGHTLEDAYVQGGKRRCRSCRRMRDRAKRVRRRGM